MKRKGRNSELIKNSFQTDNKILTRIDGVKGDTQKLLDLNLNYIEIELSDLVSVSLTKYGKETLYGEYIQNKEGKFLMDLKSFLILLLEDENGNSISKILSNSSFIIYIGGNIVKINLNTTDFILKLSKNGEKFLESKDIPKKLKIAQEKQFTRFSFNEFKDMFGKEILNNSLSIFVVPEGKIFLSAKKGVKKILD